MSAKVNRRDLRRQIYLYNSDFKTKDTVNFKYINWVTLKYEKPENKYTQPTHCLKYEFALF